MPKIGVTEQGDGGLNQSWRERLAAWEADGAIVVTKHPQLLCDQPLPDNVVVHCTITGLGNTPIEPGVRDSEFTLKAYRHLVETYGPNRVVLRVDPIIPWQPFLDKAIMVATNVVTGARLRISFLDMYPHTRRRLVALGVPKLDEKTIDGVYKNALHSPIRSRKFIYSLLSKMHNRVIEVCGEPQMGTCAGCVSPMDIRAMGLTLELSGQQSWQRGACQCIAEKAEILAAGKHPCRSNCAYCYWKDKADVKR